MTHISRRRFLGTTTAAAGAAALGSTRLTEMLSAKAAPAVLQEKAKLTYWGGLIFSDDANNLLTDTINQWGEDNNVDTEVVMINQNETNQKVSAAVESGTMPDALDMGLDLQLLLTNTGQLMELDDLYTKIGDAHGGWYASVDAAAKLAGATTGIPFGPSGNLLFSRQDVLEAAGLTPPPATWQDVRDWSKQAQKPPLFGMGLALSNVGDGNLQMSVLQSYGGRIADDAGTTVTLDTPETRTYMEWVTGAFADGLFPPGATTWDGAGDNTAYLAGQAIFIANTGSVHLAAAEDDPELDANTNFAALPAGPVMQVSPINPNVRAIPTSTEDPDTAKALIEFLANKDFMEQYLNVAIYGPALNEYASFAIFQEPVHAGLLNLVEHGTAPGAPDVYNTAYADFSANFIVPKMVQRVVVDGLSVDDAIKEAQEQGQLIYDKYK
ncbi:MAG TPA: extracellular solute-binding protein [Thermomicrobiales bacterium]|nr:extracellular solute-binding protein [Thermomicrobiales bacterium]